MGRVDLAVRRDGAFQRLYAVKRLHAAFDEPAFRRMFLEEARLAGLIRHANVVSVLDVGVDQTGPYLVMEYIEGVSLSTMLKGLRKDGEQLPVQVVCRMLSQVARGLHSAHELTDLDGSPLLLVHRDISPQNILVGYDGVARVTDFGVAKALGHTDRTATGVLKGKLGYMSPEQLSFRDIDRRSDLFSLGVVLFESLAGKRLYAGEKGPRRILDDPPPDIGNERRALPPELVQLSLELLAKRPDLRPETAEEVAERLEEIVSELSNEEGGLTVARFLADRYGGQRDEASSQVRRALEARRREEPAVTRVAEAQAPTREAPSKGPWLVAVAAAIALAVAGWFVLRGHDSSTAEAATPTQVAEPAEPQETPRGPDPVRIATPEPEPPIDEVEGTTRPAPSAMRGETMRATMRPTRSMRSEMHSAPASMDGLEIWTDF